MVLSRDFNAFYEAALSAMYNISDIAQRHDLSADEQTAINQNIGKIRDYTIPLAPVPAATPAAPVLSCPEIPPDRSLVYAAAALIVGGVIGAFVF